MKDLRSTSGVHEIFSDMDVRNVTHFVSTRDQLFSVNKQSLDTQNIEYRSHGHFDYFSGSKAIIKQTAAKIDAVLRMKNYNQQRKMSQAVATNKNILSNQELDRKQKQKHGDGLPKM